jgi:copper chaperone
MCCGCATRQPQAAAAPRELAADTLIVKVEDMTCPHCANTITRAVAAGLPGVAVAADPATKLVSVTGAADPAVIASLISGAGYTATLT